jgi:hypothetical protein
MQHVMAKMPPLEREILLFVKRTGTSSDGVHIDQAILKNISSRPEDIRRGIENLINEGHLFFTVDDNHVAAMDM